MKPLYKKFGIAVGVIAAIGIIAAILVYNGIIWPVYPSLLGYDVKGIDVARYQGDIDWTIIKQQDIRFAFMKATEGSSYTDPKFEQNMKGAEENEIAAGAYHFFSSESAGTTQAEHFIAMVPLENLDLPPVLDFEIAPENSNDKDRIVTEAIDFLTEIENHYGVKPIIYTTYESYNTYLTESFDGYPLWFRDLLKEPRVSGQEWLFWQYCNRGRLDGIDKQQKYTDLNVFNGNQQEFEDYLLEVKSQMEVTIEEKSDTPTVPTFSESKAQAEPIQEVNWIIPEGTIIKERFAVPKGFVRIDSAEGSFEHFLQNLPLKLDGTKVHYFDGREKTRDVYLAVVDYPLGDKDLQQCADAIMRLRAEYFYSQNQLDKIHFNFVSGFKADFSKWAEGYGISVNNNDVSWLKNVKNNASYESFQKYLDMVYAYSGTLSLEKEMLPKALNTLSIGDVFIKGGSPGHCVIVVDMAENIHSGEKVFMLAQGYMPAQDIQILKNPADNSPWYDADITNKLVTPEWTFERDALRSWE